ncbi:MAG: FAD-dependent oxidoreductase [Candidatus Marinimicrobia bacterium]|nr:FAD-dependent oxidoreductase [Candidatus Neomarinimicrobiota bacterium]
MKTAHKRGGRINPKKNIAIIGSGISGLTAAYYLQNRYSIQMYEQGSYIGGHTNTIDVQIGGKNLAVDTGFIVHNDRTYPNFINLMQTLGVDTQPTEMSFSVKDELSGLEYNGGSLNKLFAQRSNLLNPGFYKMIGEILRFNKQARAFLNSDDHTTTLGAYLRENKYHQGFIDKFLIPMGASIWSTAPEDMLGFPARAFINFFQNHGLLDLKNRPQWRTIKGGSREYVKKLIQGFEDRIHLNTGVKRIERQSEKIKLHFEDGSSEEFHEVIIATHSDQALAMLENPNKKEVKLLGAIPYQENTAILHTDASLLPKRKLAWASWNYHLSAHDTPSVALTYNMNILQSLDTREVINVTLNKQDQIDPAKIHKVIRYHHPLFTAEGLAAQKEKHTINGVDRIWYCGAYWGNGFHEDGVVSALDVIQGMDTSIRGTQ